MSNDELEDRLRDLEPPAPRPELRAEILDAVRAELGRPTTVGRLDRFLARPLPWAAAAALLVALLAGHVLLDRSHAEHVTSIVGSDTTVVPGEWALAKRHAWLRRWMEGDVR